MMEIALVILIIALAFIIAGKRFSSLVRNEFYTEKTNPDAYRHCHLGDNIRILKDNKSRLVVVKDSITLGYVPEDYCNTLEKQLNEEAFIPGEIILTRKNGIKVRYEGKRG